jgi:uncharacterized protein (TIGR00288 family)
METAMSEPKVMLLIDADNVSIDVIEQAVAWVHKHHGGPHVRRAYCTAESAVKHQAVFKRLSIRPMVNLAAGKNSTDIALAVDAMFLVLGEQPDVVAIASSDSDFAPLVSRIREKGCKVVGLGQAGKTGEETKSVYDDFEDLMHRGAARASRSPAPAKSAAKTTAKRAARRKPAPARASAPAPAPDASPKPMPLPDKAQAVLAAIPALLRGETVQLRVAAERLRDAGLLSKSGSSTRLFGQFPEVFVLSPAKQPNHVKATPAALE